MCRNTSSRPIRSQHCGHGCRGRYGLPRSGWLRPGVASSIGGVEVFGLKGLIIGPVLMALAIAVLRLYATETRRRRLLVTPPELAPPEDPVGAPPP